MRKTENWQERRGELGGQKHRGGNKQSGRKVSEGVIEDLFEFIRLVIVICIIEFIG